MDFEVQNWKDKHHEPRLRMVVVLLTIATKHGKKGKEILRPRQRYTKEERDSPECEAQERRQETRNSVDTNGNESLYAIGHAG